MTYLPLALYFYKLNQSSGGAERMICRLANALCERGYAVHLISLDEPLEDECFYPLDERIVWHRLGGRSGIRGKAARVSSLARLLKRERVAAFIGFVMSGDKTIYAAAKLARVPLIAAERNAPAMYRIRYGALQRLVTFASLHLTNAITVQCQDFVHGYPSSLRARIATIPNPVSPATRYASPGKSDSVGRYRLLAVSRLENDQKRLECLIDAFSKVADRHPDWDLRIVGDGPDAEALRKLISAKDLEGRVELVPATRAVEDEFCSAHLFAIPSRWEGFPNALAEALSHGLPAVGFADASGVAQLIAPGETGWLAEGLDSPENLATILDEAMSDGERRAEMRQAAVQKMKKFSPEIQFDKWEALLTAVARKRAS